MATFDASLFRGGIVGGVEVVEVVEERMSAVGLRDGGDREIARRDSRFLSWHVIGLGNTERGVEGSPKSGDKEKV